MLGAAAAVVLAGALGLATVLTAFANVPVLSANIGCVNGNVAITWTVANSESTTATGGTGRTMQITAASVSAGTLTGISVGQVLQPVPLAGSSVTGVTTLPGNFVGDVTLTVTGHFFEPSGADTGITEGASVTVHSSGGCGGTTPTPTPTNTPVPPTATPTNTPVPPTATPTNVLTTTATGQKVVVSDFAAPTGFGTPTGTVDFQLFNNSACTGTPLYDSGPVALDASGHASTNGAATQPPTLSADATYDWVVSYSGDANNAASTSPCGTEQTSIAGDTPGVDP
jgi:hypothetical protein